MKTLLNKAFAMLMMVSILYTSVGTSLAQYDYNYNASSYDWGTGSSYDYNYGSYNTGTFDYSNWGSTDPSGYNYGGSSYAAPVASPSYDYSNWTYQDPSTYNYNYGSYTNPNVDVVGTTYTNPSTTGYNYSNWTYQDPSTYNYNYGSYTNPNVDVVGTTCIGCDASYTTPTYTTPIYTTPTYTTPTYTAPVYDQPTYTTPTYTTPIYTTPTYTTPTYTYTAPTYTAPTYEQPTYTTPTYTVPTYTYTTPTYTVPTYTTPTYTTPTYTTPTYTTPAFPVTVCSDGQPPVNGSCVRTTTIPVTTNTICADGFAPVSGSCVRTTTIPVTTTTRCADGTMPNPLTGCARTTTIPVTTSTLCADGTAPSPLTGCTRTTTIPVTTNTICSDGQLPVNGSCMRTVTVPTVTYQTCWDGSVIPLSSVCPAQYKTCANGTSIPVNQTCYYAPTVPVTPPQEIKFNNVITSVTTEITKTSARCNGIGLIASGALSTGWFEYGETPSLGRETGKANIGSSPTAPFSNVLTNLKPATTYYCRAVMQNQFGTVKGEIVAFTTKSTAVTYVKPVTTKKTTKTTSYKASYAPKNEVVCVDGSVVKLESKTAAQLLNSGQKLISLQIEKTGGSLSAGSAVNYKLTFKNMSDEALRGVTVKVTIPQEITLTNASAGQYDPATRVLTINHSVLAAYSEDSVTWTGVVAKDAAAGKSLATTAYSSYSLPGTNVQDEVTAYTVGSVVPADGTASTSTGAKKVVGAYAGDRGFLPDTLVEWLALIAIIFIIAVLGRSVYTSYSNDKKTVAQH